MRKIIATTMHVAVAILCFSVAPAFASTYNCSTPDPVGDTSDSPGLGFAGEAYQDIVASRIQRTSDELIFSMQLAAPIPAAPRLKNPNGLLLWMWGMNTGTTFPCTRSRRDRRDSWNSGFTWRGTAMSSTLKSSTDGRP